MAPILHICTASPHSPASSAASDSASDDSTQSPISKRFPCKFTGCEKDFSTSGQLSRHNRIHKGIKKFQCNVDNCTRTFFRADNREQHSKSHYRRLNLKLMREREAIACTVLTSGVSHAALESRFPFSNLLVEDALPRSPPVVVGARNDADSASRNPFTGYPTIYPQQPQGFHSTFVIPSSSNRSDSSGSSYSGNACKTSIKFLCE
ncbi:hypothetical protein BJ741DRAFT_705223 [Chytriomyces cf. hyalinus JEL632]|nr:hypothetical protein BJ741DRAFT_705223 [Chytriomyces cf. hyalinus JEL632]